MYLRASRSVALLLNRVRGGTIRVSDTAGLSTAWAAFLAVVGCSMIRLLSFSSYGVFRSMERDCVNRPLGLDTSFYDDG